MTIDRTDDFYATYGAYKRYRTPAIRPKHVRWYDREFWVPAGMTPKTSVLELGSGTGEFLAYLRAKGVERFHGVERDGDAVAAMPEGFGATVSTADIWDYLGGARDGAPFERVVLLDVLEHFTAPDGARLLEAVKNVLTADGKVVVRVPNMGSPWGAMHQFSDLTHKTAYTAGSLEQLALAAGYEAECFVSQKRGSPVRRFTEDMLHCVLGAILTAPPAQWSANVIAVFKRVA